VAATRLSRAMAAERLPDQWIDEAKMECRYHAKHQRWTTPPVPEEVTSRRRSCGRKAAAVRRCFFRRPSGYIASTLLPESLVDFSVHDEGEKVWTQRTSLGDAATNPQWAGLAPLSQAFPTCWFCRRSLIRVGHRVARTVDMQTLAMWSTRILREVKCDCRVILMHAAHAGVVRLPPKPYLSTCPNLAVLFCFCIVSDVGTGNCIPSACSLLERTE
jgi:hypothetical protein